MQVWIEEQIEKKCIKKLTPEECTASGSHRILGIASLNEWYDGGVSIDWTGLHHLLDMKLTNGIDMSPYIKLLNEFGAAQFNEYGEEDCVLTVLELDAPWELQELDEVASKLSVFTASNSTLTSENPSKESKDLSVLEPYAFLRGPAGLQPVVKTAHEFLSSLEKQLREQKVRVVRFLGSLVLFESNVTTLMHHTAAVHKAVKGAGLKLNIHRSSLAPQPGFVYGSSPDVHLTWTTRRLRDLKNEEDVVLFTVDLFYQWLQDAYDWRCLTPIKVFAQPLHETENEGGKLSPQKVEALVAERRKQLFLSFVHLVLSPCLRKRLDFPALAEMLEDDEDDFAEQSAQHLKKKRELIGPQKWTTLDLRVVLCHAGAYSVNPVTLFGAKK